MELKKIALNSLHESLGAKMVPFAGYMMPVRYTSDIEEHKTVREGVGIFDVSHMGEFMLSGPGALDLIQKVTSNDASRISTGQAQYSCLPNEKNGIVDDLLVYKLADEHFMLVVNASNIEKDWNWISRFKPDNCDMQNVSDDISLFAVQGPKAVEALQPLTNEDLSSIKFYHFVTAEFAGITDVIISATGYTGAGGFELYIPNAFAEKAWNAIMESGEKVSIKPIGLGARDTLRMEMGYCLYGNDIDDTTSPIEAGLGWITKFTKDFVNAENLKEQKDNGVSRKLVGFKMIDKGIPRNGYNILDTDNTNIGHVTSGTMSPSLGIGIGLGYVQTDHAKPGTEVFIEVRKRILIAAVHKLPLI
jgi:aminomethyltransferase